jgi:hypothetical protein
MVPFLQAHFGNEIIDQHGAHSLVVGLGDLDTGLVTGSGQVHS